MDTETETETGSDTASESDTEVDTDTETDTGGDTDTTTDTDTDTDTATAAFNTAPEAGYGGALEFATDDYVRIPNSADLDFSGASSFTVSMWIRPTAPGGCLYRLMYAASGQFQVYTRVRDDGTLDFALGSFNVVWDWQTTTDTVPFDEWSFVTFVKDGSDSRVYIDGALVFEDAVDSTVLGAAATTGPTDLGVDAWNWGNDYHGEMDEVRIWDAALDQAAIQAWMYRGIDSTHSSYANLKAYYRFDEGTGTVLTDHAGSNDGALNDMEEGDWVDSTVATWKTQPDTAFTGYLAHFDADGDALTFSVTEQGTLGTVTITDHDTGEFEYTPTAFAVGSDTFTYQVDDGTDTSPTTETVSVEINSWPEAGYGGALEFATDDYVRIPNSADLDFSGASSFTVSMWIRPTGNGGMLYRLMYGGVGQFQVYTRVRDDGTLDFALGSFNVVWDWQTTTDTVPFDEWSFVTFVKDGGNSRVYIDGVLVFEDAVDATVLDAAATTGPTDLGVDAWDWGKDYHGEMDEVRIWDAALDQAAIQAWMYRGIDATHASYSNLTAYYRFDEGSGAVLTDHAGENDGALNDMEAEDWVDSTVRTWSTPADTTFTGYLAHFDADGDALTFIVTQQGTLGTVTITDHATGEFQYVPNTSVTGDDTFTYEVHDGTDFSATTETVEVTIY